MLVTGATGKQGGATVRQLLRSGAKVRALTRKPNGVRAHKLADLGCEVVQGDLNDPVSLDKAMNDVYGLFLTTNFWELGTGKKEVIQCKNVTDVARAHQVQHLVLASIARCDDNPGLPNFVSKYESEQLVKASGIPFTFLRAVYFMDNLIPGEERSTFHWGILPRKLGTTTTLQMISTEDVGWFAANALRHPDQWIGRTIDIAGDEVTYPQLLETYIRVMGDKPRQSSYAARMIPLLMPDIGKMFDWYREPRFRADIPGLRTIHPGLQSTEDFFKSVHPRYD